MALHLVSSEQLRTSCRQRLESCELWLRRIVDDQLRPTFGNNYVETANHGGNTIFRSEIRKHIADRQSANPGRYPRPIDAAELDHLAAVICKTDVYAKFFRAAFEHGFPLGSGHLRLILARLIPIRNALSHANPLTLHAAVQALCYCDDITTTLVEHYQSLGMSQDYDAPSIVRFSDSLGNVAPPSSTHAPLNLSQKAPLRPGDFIRLEVEIDAHFSPDEYEVRWKTGDVIPADEATGTSFQLTFETKHVNQSLPIWCFVTSKKDWHRHGAYDAILTVFYRVLPPI